MPLNNPQPGFGWNADFSMSGLPWVTSSIAPVSPNPLRVDFQMATRLITLTNTSLAGAGSPVLSFAFTMSGTFSPPGNKYYLSGSQTLTMEIRCKTIFIQGEGASCPFSMLAGLTTVPAKNFPIITGSNGSDVWNGVG